jgi:hypothetical protein
MEQHHFPQAERTFQEALSRSRRVLDNKDQITTNIMYNLACLAALRGRSADAFVALRKVIDLEAGYPGPDKIAEDDDLKSLRDDPQFKVLMEKARESVAKHSSKETK